ncbi:hypothetical protein [Leifsonia sp. 2MCAF36]|uniref:hypothetical protein n=1 Tax=Leifsonia sp. 2MCAF36 TaxID=3232988 RepID=UPI003F975EF7
MADTSTAIILGAAISSSVALAGVVGTVIAGARQQRKTLEFSATQARLGREADRRRDQHAAAQVRYQRVRAILDAHVSLAREIRSSTSAWQIVVGSQTVQDRIRRIIERVGAVWEVTEKRRGDFELEPGLDDLRETFSRLTGAYNVFTNVAVS